MFPTTHFGLKLLACKENTLAHRETSPACKYYKTVKHVHTQQQRTYTHRKQHWDTQRTNINRMHVDVCGRQSPADPSVNMDIWLAAVGEKDRERVWEWHKDGSWHVFLICPQRERSRRRDPVLRDMRPFPKAPAFSLFDSARRPREQVRGVHSWLCNCETVGG